ncbi:MAG: acyl-CoA dehydrogenase C-terminal domain-containing protein, partial [Burkholderiales bacterium]
LDLVGRKLPAHTGRYLRHFFHPVADFISKHSDNKEMKEFIKPLSKAIDSLQKASLWLADQGLRDPENAAAGSVEYLRLFALAIMGFHWAQMANIALLKQADDEAGFYASKVATARFFMQKILPAHYSLLASITAGAKPIMQESIWKMD